MSFRKVFAAIVMASFATVSLSRLSIATDYTWNVLGGGTQAWSSSANWLPNSAFPNATTDTSDLRVGLAANLALDVGASGTVTTGTIAFGGTAGAVTTDVTSSGGAIVLNNSAANATILSQGVAGSVNRISAPLILGKNTDVATASTRDFTIAGNLGQVGVNAVLTNQMSSGQTLYIGTGTGSRIQLYDSLTGAARPIAINNLDGGTGAGTATQSTVVNAIWDPNGTSAGIAFGTTRNATATYQLLQSQTIIGTATTGRQSYIAAANDAFGLGELALANNNNTNTWGQAITSTDDARVLGNRSVYLQNPFAVTGSNSLTFSGTLRLQGNKTMGNSLSTGKTLTFTNQTALSNDTNARTLTVDGQGTTRLNGPVINSQSADGSTNSGVTKRGTGRLELNNAGNTVNGALTSAGGLLVFGTAGAYGGASSSIVTNDTGGVSYAPGTADAAGFAAFASKLVSSGTGFLALPASDSNASLNFSTGQTLASGSNMSVVGDGNMTFTGVVTPGLAGYLWGGLSGTLTLGANASVGSNNVAYKNGGTVIVAGNQTYTGTTQILGGVMSTAQAGIATRTSITNANVSFPSTLSVSSVANAGSASSLGASSNAAANLVLDRATLRHTGASNSSTDRLFTIGVNGATLESTGAGAVTYGSGGGANVTAGTGARALTLGGTSTATNAISSVLANGAAGSDLLSLIKADAGLWVLGGANTYTGTTAVLAGTLLVNGNQSAATGAISVATNASLGGSGTMGGNVTFGSGALFAFNAAAPLAVSGSVTFTSAATFGVSSLSGLTSSTPDAIYPLIAGNVNLTGLANFGSSNAYNLGSGKTAYFQALSPSGLSLVVVPEPTSIAAAISGLGLAALILRRRARD